MKKRKNEPILEYVSAQNTRSKIDRDAGVIYDVKILGMSSRNNRIYPEETLRRAIPLYENARVNLNHPDGDPNESRKYQDRFGLIKNVRLESGEGLFGDFHFNPKHPIAEQLLWDAEKSPENVGFSHNVQAVLNLRDGKQVVDKICFVRSVDLVADPATTDGLFESYRENTEESAASAENESSENNDQTAIHQTNEQMDSAKPLLDARQDDASCDLTIKSSEPSETSRSFEVSSDYPSSEESASAWTQSVLQSENGDDSLSERPREKKFGLLSRCLQKLWSGKGNRLQEEYWPEAETENNPFIEESQNDNNGSISETSETIEENQAGKEIKHYKRRTALLENLLESVLKDEIYPSTWRTRCWNRRFVALLMEAEDPKYAERLVEERQELIRELCSEWNQMGIGETIESVSGTMVSEANEEDSASEFIRQIKQIV